MARTMCGRRMILTDVRTIDESNVVQVLQKAFVTHLANKIDILKNEEQIFGIPIIEYSSSCV